MPQSPKEILETILNTLGFNSTVTEQVIDGVTVLNVDSEDAGRLIGREGRTLSSLQFLVNRVVFSQDPQAPKVTVDVANYRAKAREELVNKAKAAAEKVRRWGEPIELGPLNAFDRWVVHQALRDATDLETRSVEIEGSSLKAIIIRPKR